MATTEQPVESHEDDDSRRLAELAYKQDLQRASSSFSVGLSIAYVLPVYLRWRKGDDFRARPWTLGRKYEWINPAACLWVAICVIIFVLPQAPAGVPWRDEFDWKYVNYAPTTVGGLILIVGIWWLVRARHTVTGPVRNIEFDAAAGVVEK